MTGDGADSLALPPRQVIAWERLMVRLPDEKL
jgi:hypothetical protein